MNQFDNIPDELRRCKQWVNWQYEERGGEVAKIPIDPKTGKRARSNDPATWSSFETAIKRSPQVGFVFLENDPYVGIDLDHCRDAETGEIAAWAKKICEAVAEGLTYQAAAALGGIDRHTLANWRRAHPEFADALEQAESEFVRHHVGNIVAAADKGTWQASAWLLERKFPASFALRAELRLDQNDGPTEEEADYEDVLEGSPKLRKMGRDFFRAIEDERHKREGGNGNGRVQSYTCANK